MKRIAAFAFAALVTTPALADDPKSAAGLLGEGYGVVTSFMTQLGPAIFLQKQASLYLCFLTETPDNPVITTNYCKQVR